MSPYLHTLRLALRHYGRFCWPATFAAATAAAQNAGCAGTAAQDQCRGSRCRPPNVVHTAIYVAKELGLFAKHCIDANVIQF